MNIFSRRELYITRDLQALNNIKNCLLAQGIDHQTRTNSITNPGRSHGIPFIQAEHACEYRLYVNRADYERARHAAGL